MSSTIRLYFPDKIQSDLSSHLTKDQTHYVKDVMRLKIEDKLSIFNTQGEWSAVIKSYEKNGAKIKVMEKDSRLFEPELRACRRTSAHDDSSSSLKPKNFSELRKRVVVEFFSEGTNSGSD